MKAYVCNDVKLRQQDSVREVRNNTKLYVKTFDKTIVRDSTIGHSLSVVTTELLRNSGLLTQSIVTSFFVVLKYGGSCSRSEAKRP